MGKDTSKQKMAWVQVCWAASGCGLFAATMLTFTESNLVRISGWLGLAMLAAGCNDPVFLRDMDHILVPPSLTLLHHLPTDALLILLFSIFSSNFNKNEYLCHFQTGNQISMRILLLHIEIISLAIIKTKSSI